MEKIKARRPLLSSPKGRETEKIRAKYYLIVRKLKL
jgi:hypothetical protein